MSALPLAIAFAAALNLLLIARYIYPELMSGGLVTMACWIGLAAWLVYVVRAMREVPTLIAPRTVSVKPDRFPQAQAAFLAGNWQEAEGLLTDVLSIEPRDPPALLMLSGLYRQTGRLESAQILLQEITRLEIADGWWVEVETEAQRLKRAVEIERQRAEKEGDATTNPARGAADLTAPQRAAA